MEPGVNQGADHGDGQQSERTDRIAKWVQQYDDNEPAASFVASRHGTEASLISDLHDECLQTIRHLRSTLEGTGNSDARPDEKARLGHCHAKLNLWGDALHGGKLEVSLRIVPGLRSTILEALIRIGQAFLIACDTHLARSRVLASEHYQGHTSSLKSLIDQAQGILTPQDSDLPEPRNDKVTEADSNEFSVDKKMPENSSNSAARTWLLELLRTLTFRTRLLMEILPAIQQISTTAERGKRHKPGNVPVENRVSEAAREWVRQVFDKFEGVNRALANRLGEANAQRYNEIRRLKSQDYAPAELVQPSDTGKPLFFQTPTTIHDSRSGRSIVAPADDLVSVAHSSLASSVADESSGRVPETPKAVAWGKPFECEICGSLLSNIKNRTQWKAHVFADIKPYICTFGGCNDHFTVFPSRRAWADHEFQNHRCHITFTCYGCPEQFITEDLLLEHLRKAHFFEASDPQRSAVLILNAKKVEGSSITEEICPLCQKTGWQTQQAFIKHLGKHMEDIALLALPTADDSDSPQDSDQSDEEGKEPSSKPGLSGGPLISKEKLNVDETARPQPAVDQSTKMAPPRSERRQQRADSDDSDEDIPLVYFFVPGENIDATVLVDYILRYIDRNAKITSGMHPTDKTRSGFSVSAQQALNGLSIRDIINDSRDWNLETQSREYRRKPYYYRESDTARRRARKGPSEGGTSYPQQPKGPRFPSTDPYQQTYQSTTDSYRMTYQPAYQPAYQLAYPTTHQSTKLYQSTRDPPLQPKDIYQAPPLYASLPEPNRRDRSQNPDILEATDPQALDRNPRPPYDDSGRRK